MTFYEFRDKVREWAQKNALTLAFITVLFILTWVWIFVVSMWNSVQ